MLFSFSVFIIIASSGRKKCCCNLTNLNKNLKKNTLFYLFFWLWEQKSKLKILEEMLVEFGKNNQIDLHLAGLEPLRRKGRK